MGVDGMKFVITGSGTGIGRATAEVAASKGAKVMVSDLNDDNGQQVVDGIRKAGGTAEYFHCDVTNPKEVEAFSKPTGSGDCFTKFVTMSVAIAVGP